MGEQSREHLANIVEQEKNKPTEIKPGDQVDPGEYITTVTYRHKKTGEQKELRIGLFKAYVYDDATDAVGLINQAKRIITMEGLHNFGFDAEQPVSIVLNNTQGGDTCSYTFAQQFDRSGHPVSSA